MANYLKMHQKHSVTGLIGQGWSNRKIAKVLGIDKRTVAKYRAELQNVPPPTGLSENVPPPPTGSGLAPVTSQGPESNCEPYRSLIEEKLKNGQHVKSMHYDLVHEHGAQVGYDSLKRFVRRMRKKTPELVTRLAFECGEAAQVDFGQGAPTAHPKTGKYRKPWLFQMTLCRSRKAYYEVVWDQSADTFIACHKRAFNLFGGIPRTIILDNLKAAVIKASWEDPDFNRFYNLFAQHSGFVPLPCHVASPTEKGIVESGVKYGQGILAGRKFESLDEQNRFLRDWEEREAGTRIHGTTKRQVNAMFAEEQPHLQPLPDAPFELVRTCRRRVFVDGTIEVKGTYYPVPEQYLGIGDVEVHVYEKMLRIYAGDHEIVAHPIMPKGTRLPRPWPAARQVPATRAAWISQLLDWASRQSEATVVFAEAVLSTRPEDGYRFLTALKVQRRLYGAVVFEQAVKEASERAIYRHKPFKLMCERIAAEERFTQELIQEDELIRSMDQYSLAFLNPQPGQS